MFIKLIILFKNLSMEQKLNDDTVVVAEIYSAFCEFVLLSHT